MSGFDAFLVVDWSANNTPKRGQDSIWWALIDKHGKGLTVENPPTRAIAIGVVTRWIRHALTNGKRLLVGFDFGFGYVCGFAQQLCGKPDWEAVWQRIAASVVDTDNNTNNRFAVGNLFNQHLASGGDTPFWGHPHQHAGRYSHLGPRKPVYVNLPERRAVEEVVASTQPVFKLAYTGSVGSQTLLGIARLQALREQFGRDVAIWPFETDFERALSAPVVIAEVYPSIVPVSPMQGEVKDAAQVRTLATFLSEAQRNGRLARLLAFPDQFGAEVRARAVREEGWIVGAGQVA